MNGLTADADGSQPNRRRHDRRLPGRPCAGPWARWICPSPHVRSRTDASAFAHKGEGGFELL